MKSQYTKKQILEAIKHWEKELDEQYTSHDARIEDRIKDSDIRSQSDDDNIMKSFNEFLKQYDALSPEDKKTAILTVLIPSMNEAQLTRCIGYIGVSPAVKKCMKQLLYAFQNYFDDYPGSFDERVYESIHMTRSPFEYPDADNVDQYVSSKYVNAAQSIDEFGKKFKLLEPIDREDVLDIILSSIDKNKLEDMIHAFLKNKNKAKDCIKQIIYAFQMIKNSKYDSNDKSVYESKKDNKINDKCIDEYDDEENGTTIDDIKKSDSWNYVFMGAKSRRYNQMESLKQFIKLLYKLKSFEQDSVLASILGNIDSSKIEKRLKNDINTSNAQKCIKQFLYAIKDYNEWHYSNDNEYVYESKKSKKLR